MTDYGIVKSSVKPEPFKIDEYSVWKHYDIREISENVGEENEFIGYEYRMVQYDKDEYLQMQIAENSELAEQIINTQLALCELCEDMKV